MKLILIGAPAAGKGTQAKRLIKHYNIAHISTGDILRDHIDKGTELGEKIKSVMACGGLVSDDIIMELVKSRISEDDCKNGYIFDGFPRTVAQAEMLYDIIGNIDRVIYINTPDEYTIERLAARETCPKCGSTYNKLSIPSKVKGVCDVCNEKLIQRKDDTVEAGKIRLKTFHEQSEPLVDYYKKKNLLFEVNGLLDIDEVTKVIISELGEKA